ncbi:acyltransferase [Rhodophyticola sp. CCM32]|uniref:acyltransferase family protein n=1 Tax=Rhodophyticola sp. CCM32 TaxID=2916397 RepID=UPI00107FA96E|nr:acyltransferase [Rhodophyticola sp. CCM32]QBY01301.1 acyltransferase [Rhodophyticola sp. CCM32]
MSPGQSTLLDALRAFAAHCVLLGHILSLSIFPELRTGLGDLGVVIFFVLSGFLIASTSTAKADRSRYLFQDYLLDRAFRIFAPYLPALIAVFILDGLTLRFSTVQTYAEYFTLKDFTASLLMLQQFPPGIILDEWFGLNAAKLSTFGSARPFWTVANEWWLYVCFGMIFFSIVSKHRKTGFVFLLAAAIVPVFNFVAGTGDGLSLLWVVMALMGVFYARRPGKTGANMPDIKVPDSKLNIILTMALICTLLLAVVRFLWISYLHPSLAPGTPVVYDFNLYVLIAFAMSLMFFLVRQIENPLGHKSIRFLAGYSYSLYLIHYSIIYFCDALELGPKGKATRLLFLYLLCNVAAVLLWALFERHHRRLRYWVSGRPDRQGS